MELKTEMVLECGVKVRDAGGKTFQAKLGDFPPHAVEKILRYGFQRIFNDAVGSGDLTVEDKVRLAGELIERYKQGDVGRKASGGGVDALTREVRKQVGIALRAKAPDVWKKLKDLEDDKKAKKLDAIAEKNPKIVEIAKAELKRKEAEAKKLAAVEVEL